METPRINFVEFNRDHKSQAKYALLSYSTTNLGDEIQSIAARSFLPEISTLVDRDYLSKVEIDSPHKIILNGWYSHRPENWPPSKSLVPLILGFHASRAAPNHKFMGRPFTKRLKRRDSIAYLKANGPIGARDYHTAELLRRLDIPSYFSGCLTLTLTASTKIEKMPFVCVNDLDDEVLHYVRQKSDLPIVRTTHENSGVIDPRKRMELAQDLLSTYASASFVVTSRLHCALPCLALGTPVLFCPTATDTYRFSGLSELLRHTTRKDMLQNQAPFEFRAPSPNPNKYLDLRENLIARCNSFIRDAC